MTLSLRDNRIDAMRAFGIIMIVIGHCGTKMAGYIYAFHVPYFFIISGMLSKEVSDTKGLLISCIKKVKRLYLPYVLVNVFFVIMNNSFITSGFYSTESFYIFEYNTVVTAKQYFTFSQMVLEVGKVILFAGGTQMGAALWFLRVSFISGILFEAELLFLRGYRHRKWILLFFNSALFLAGSFFGKKGFSLPYSIDICCSVSIFYYLGWLFKPLYQKTQNKASIPYSIIVILVFFAIYIAISPLSDVDLAHNSYTSPVTLILTSCSAFIVLALLISVLYSFLPPEKTRLVQRIGKETMSILCFHFLAFKLVTYILILLRNEPLYYLAAFPVLDSSKWYLYTIVGVFMPFGIIIVIKKIMRRRVV